MFHRVRFRVMQCSSRSFGSLSSISLRYTSGGVSPILRLVSWETMAMLPMPSISFLFALSPPYFVCKWTRGNM